MTTRMTTATTATAPTTAAATHEIQVAVETSEDRRNRNETGWSPTLPGHNASSLLFLVESWNSKVARKCCTTASTSALDRTRNPRTTPRTADLLRVRGANFTDENFHGEKNRAICR
ncbi:unnamed protein product [Lasius platythorax]|uniref:Uncharacterized protein n=1 Tax=Lasius platythorax TaxID=488582 RepID=A0AAV2NA30_9HYME